MFDLSSVKSTPSEEAPLPDGKYIVVCTDASLKDTKAGNGQYIAATFTVKTGEHKGERIRENYNVLNPNPTAVKIGREGIKGFFENSTYDGDFKFETPTDAVSEMLGLIVGVETKLQESRNPEYGPSARIKKYFKPTKGASPASPAKDAAPQDDIGW